MAMNTINPYVGPRSFTHKDRSFFFGREREAHDLLALVIAARVTLFYAQSGAGKTSLLTTCLIPELEENDRTVLPVGRVSSSLPVGVDEVDNIFVFNLMLQLDQGSTAPVELAHLDLRSFLRKYESIPKEARSLADSDDAPGCVLIIDQFEELLTAYPERWQERAGFFRQLNQAMQDDPKPSVVLVLREDYVAALEPYAPLMADRMRARFYMERMDRKAALAAISQPAAQQGRPFAPGAAELLVDHLSLIRTSCSKEAKPGEHIEPVQLQVVCYQLWEKTAQTDEITADQVTSLADKDHHIAEFYEQTLAEAMRVAKVSQLQLRHWIEHQLITPEGTRGTVFQGDKSTAGMDNAVVRLLAGRFLLCAESRSGAVSYELVHDRFVEPIVQANRAWLKAQGPLLRDAQIWREESNKTDWSVLYTGEKLAKTLAEIGAKSALEPVVIEFLEYSKARQAWLDKKAAANRKLHTWFKIAVTVAVVAVLAGFWAIRANYKARAAKDDAEHWRIEADHYIGLSLNAQAKVKESEGSRYFAHIYSLYALDKMEMAQSKDTDAYQEAVIRAQANPVPLPAVKSQLGYSVRLVAFSQDNKRIALALENNTVIILDTVTGKLLKPPKEYQGEVIGLSFSQDGLKVASATDNNGTLVIRDAETGNVLHLLIGHTELVKTVDFSPDGRRIASGSIDHSVIIWDATTGNLLNTFQGHDQRVTHVSFSQDGRKLASASMDKTICIWDVETGKLIKKIENVDVVSNITFSSDNSLAYGLNDNTIIILDIKNWNTLHTLEGHNSRLNRLSFSPDSRLLVSASDDNTIHIWNIETGKSIQTFQGHDSIFVDSDNSITSVSFSPDGCTIASSSLDSTVSFWEASSSNLGYLKGKKDNVLSFALLPDGRLLTSSSTHNSISSCELDVSTGRCLQKRLLPTIDGQKNVISRFTFSHNGRFAAAMSLEENTDGVSIWELQTGKLLRRKVINKDGFGNMSASSNGIINIVLWKELTQKQLEFGQMENLGDCIGFSPDGRLAAFCMRDNSIDLFDISTHQPIKTLRGHTKAVTSVAFSPDSLLIASSSMDGTIGIWDVKSGKRMRTLMNKRSTYEDSIAFSPDSHFLAFSMDDNTVGLWDLRNNINEWSGISLDQNGEYQLELDKLPCRLEGLDLKPDKEKEDRQDKLAQWSQYHPFHWLPKAEAGDKDAMLELGIIYDRNNDIARALQWYQRAIKAGSSQAQEQQSRLLHWLKESEENWQSVPSPFRDAFCKTRAEFELPEKVPGLCEASLLMP